MLTESVTRSLPISWQGSYTVDRARIWIEERDNEGAALLVVDKSTVQPVGLIVLFETEAESKGCIEVRIGYMLSEWTWGKGIASELLGGFVGWCRGHASIFSIVGGVAQENFASRRVLEKNGFMLVQSEGEPADQEQRYRLSLR